MSWRVARSLDVLLAEVDGWRRDRDRASDGSIGDADHRNRQSDHNPWAPPGEGGVVTARDFDEDDDQQVGRRVLKATVGRRDPRVKYVIYEGQIWRSYRHHSGHPEPWTPQVYTGSNAHAHHIHVSVHSDRARFDDESPWGLSEDDDMTPEQDRMLRDLHQVIGVDHTDDGVAVVRHQGEFVGTMLRRMPQRTAEEVGFLQVATLTAAVAAIRKAAGVDPNPDWDRQHAERVAAGDYDLDEVADRMLQVHS